MSSVQTSHGAKQYIEVLIQYDWVVLVAIAPFVLFISPTWTPILLIIPLLWLLRKMTKGHFITQTPIDLSLLVLLLMVLISLLVTSNLALSFPKVAGVVFGVAVFYSMVAAISNTGRSLWFGAAALVIVGCGVAALGMMGTDWSGTLPVPLLRVLTDRLPRLIALPGYASGFHPNRIAGALLWTAPFAVLLASASIYRFITGKVPHNRKRRFYHLMLIGAAIFLIVTLILTQSRGAWLGFTLSLVFMFLVIVRRNRTLVFGTILLVAILIAIVFILVGIDDSSTLLFPQEEDVLGDVLSTDTFIGRLMIWDRALIGVRDFAFTGMGMGTFSEVVQILYPFFLINAERDIDHAHNNFLQVALDVGIPGLIAYLTIWIGAGIMLWRVWRISNQFWPRMFVLGCAGSLVAYFSFGLTDTIGLGDRPGIVFWILLGFIAGLHQLISRGNEAHYGLEQPAHIEQGVVN